MMRFLITLSLLSSILLFSTLISFASALCKSTPGSSTWPSTSEWQQLNASLSNRLLKPLPPAAPCHTNEPTYNQLTCKFIQSQWMNGSWHAEDPISVDNNNWSNDTCLPESSVPCSGVGYPIYVVNASTADHVKTGIDFARNNSIRLVVKGTGHDYLGRSIAPNSLSIWTHNMRGLAFHKSFQPKGCDVTIEAAAVTMAAGEQWGNIYTQAGALNQVIVGPGPGSVGIGGYLTGGGHSPISAMYGTGADQVLEMDVVTAAGDMLTANECQNTDLFWALRGGGGSTFAVITSVAVKTFPSTPVTSFNMTMFSAVNSSAYWEANAYLLSNYPKVIDAGLYGYVFTGGSYSGAGPTGSVYLGTFLAPNKSIADIEAVTGPLIQHINTTWPGQIAMTTNSHSWNSFYDWWKATITDVGVGTDYVAGNRLLDSQALSQPQSTLIQTLRDVTPPGGLVNINLIAGPGVWNVKPRGGNDSINPAWRKAYVEFAIPSTWTASPLDKTLQATAIHKLTTQYLPALSTLAGPNPACYINEDNPYEANLSAVFWGANYPRLLSIKKTVDPHDVFWCAACVGHEEWAEDGKGGLCQTQASTGTGTNSSSAAAPTKTSGGVRAFGGEVGMRMLRVCLRGLRLGRGGKV